MWGMPRRNWVDVEGLYTLLTCTDHLVVFAQSDTSKCVCSAACTVTRVFAHVCSASLADARRAFATLLLPSSQYPNPVPSIEGILVSSFSLSYLPTNSGSFRYWKPQQQQLTSTSTNTRQRQQPRG